MERRFARHLPVPVALAILLGLSSKVCAVGLPVNHITLCGGTLLASPLDARNTLAHYLSNPWFLRATGLGDGLEQALTPESPDADSFLGGGNLGSAPAEPASDGPPVRQTDPDHQSSAWVSLLPSELASGVPGQTGTSSSSAERGPVSQVGILIEQEFSFSRMVSRLVGERRVLPSTPYIGNLFRPPRDSTISNTVV
jgi:hypothetical protein